MGDSAQRKSTIAVSLLIGVRVVDNGTTANVADLLIRNAENAAENLSQQIRETVMFDDDMPPQPKPELLEEFDQICENNLIVKKLYLQDKQDKTKTSEYAEFYMIPKVIMRAPYLSVYEKLVFSAILGRIRKQGGGRCYPGTECLARECGISVRCVSNSLDNLRNYGWLNWKINGRNRLFRIYSPPEQSSFIVNSAHANEIRFRRNIKSEPV